MANLKTHRINQTGLLLAVCIASAMLGFALRDNKTIAAKTYPALILQQSDEKVIEKYDHGNEPVELDNLSIKTVKIAPGQKFSAKAITEMGGGRVEDWLENLEFTINNKANKQITFILIEFQFPETDASGARMVYNKLGIGIPPKASANALKYSKQLALNSGDTTTYTLSTRDLTLIKDFLALNKFQLADLNEMAIRLVYVIFDDGMKWELRHYYRPNPGMPGGYELVN
ncbi:MAG: hypothetical protein WBV94_25595 [Blastocatellia bacterium]